MKSKFSLSILLIVLVQCRFQSSCFLRRPQRILNRSDNYQQSKRQIDGKDFVIFFGLLRKHELCGTYFLCSISNFCVHSYCYSTARISPTFCCLLLKGLSTCHSNFQRSNIPRNFSSNHT